MSGNNIARKIQRRMLRAGNMTPETYKALRRKIDVQAIDDSVNDRIRYEAWVLTRLQRLAGAGTAQARNFANLLKQTRLRELIYHPTKGFRSSRGAEVEAENLRQTAA